MQEKYGVNHPLQNAQIRDKMKATVIARHGVENVAQLKSTQKKIAATSVEKYGVEHYNQLPEMKDYLRINCREWLAEAWTNPWAKGFTRPQEWNDKARSTITTLIQDGKWISAAAKTCLKGWYQSKKCKKNPVYFRSSYELKTLYHLDNSDLVDWYDYEPFMVPYNDNEGNNRYYTVDLVIKFKDLHQLIAIEIKNNYTKNSPINLCKYQAFREQCGELIQLEIWADDEIKALGLDLEELKKLPEVDLQ